MKKNEWPYELKYGEKKEYSCDVLILGGGIAGCMAALGAREKGLRVILVEKGAVAASGAGGAGCDHWESAATNPCSKVTPEELVDMMLRDNKGFNNGISHYIECREGYDRLLDIEKMGGKIRDTEDEFKGADFRDEDSKLMFAYDYKNKFTIRIWGTTFKKAMAKKLKRVGVTVVERVMVTSLLTDKGEIGGKVVGATGIHTRTGEFMVFKAKASVMAMSRPARIWLFNPAMVGLSEFRPTQCIGSGHAMGWRAGAAFNMMEKSVRAEFSAAGKSYPPYGAGNNHNTWYPASIIDANGKTVPYTDRDGRILTEFKERCLPADEQKFFMKGGGIDGGIYEIEGPETISVEGNPEYKLPLYADLSDLPEQERNVIWGMMVGEEGKTKVPILKNYTEAGFDPKKHVLQCYGSGWKSATFLPDERQLFGLPGGFMNDWHLRSNLEGLYVAGDALFASDCYGHAAATGHYAGRHAADYVKEAYAESENDKSETGKNRNNKSENGKNENGKNENGKNEYTGGGNTSSGNTDGGNTSGEISEEQVKAEWARISKPVMKSEKEDSFPTGYRWQEVNMAIAKTMQHYCGEIRTEDMLNTGLAQLERIEEEMAKKSIADNPHELTRLLEVMDILTVSKLIIQASKARKCSVTPLCFKRGDETEKPDNAQSLCKDEVQDFLVIKNTGAGIETSHVPLDYYGDLSLNYEKYNAEYLEKEAVYHV